MPQLLTINVLTFACILASTTDLYLSLPVIMTSSPGSRVSAAASDCPHSSTGRWGKTRLGSQEHLPENVR